MEREGLVAGLVVFIGKRKVNKLGVVDNFKKGLILNSLKGPWSSGRVTGSSPVDGGSIPPGPISNKI